MNAKKLCIATLDPAHRGGIYSMMSYVYAQAQRSHLSPFLAYNAVESVRREHAVFSHSPKNVAFGDEDVSGMRGLFVRRILPVFEFFNYLLNLRYWKQVLGRANLFFAVAGSNNCALPFVFLRKPFSLWVASTLFEDRIDRIRRERFLYKIRDILSLPILLFFEWLVFVRARRILALSNYTKQFIVRKYPSVAAKIDVAFFPMNTETFTPIAFTARAGDYFIFTGRFMDERKNIRLLLASFADAAPDSTGMRLKIIGDSADAALLDFCRDLGIAGRVDFIATLPRHELISYYQNAAAFILPSFQEGLCISALEAMSCGIPVISTACGGPEDFVINDKTGFLVANNDAAQMTAAIARILAMSPIERQKLGDGARQYILDYHQSESIWPLFLKAINP